MKQKPPKTLTDSESQTLLKALLTHHLTRRSTATAHRNHLAALLMLDAGLRVAEVAGLTIRDLWIGEAPVPRLVLRREIAKGHVERTVPLTAPLFDAIQLAHRIVWILPDEQSTRPAIAGRDSDRPLSTQQLERIIKATAQRCLSRVVTPHMLRHTFATRLMRGTPMPVLQRLLGHRSLNSTQIYLHPDLTDLDKAIAGLDNPPHEK